MFFNRYSNSVQFDSIWKWQFLSRVNANFWDRREKKRNPTKPNQKAKLEEPKKRRRKKTKRGTKKEKKGLESEAHPTDGAGGRRRRRRPTATGRGSARRAAPTPTTPATTATPGRTAATRASATSATATTPICWPNDKIKKKFMESLGFFFDPISISEVHT